MDSRFMNAYHDDPYDPNYGSYEGNVTEIWSTDNIIMENMELTDNLNGILPIAATEAGNESYCNIFFPDEHIFENSQVKNENAFSYKDFEKEHLKAEEVGTIEMNDSVKNNAIDLLNLIEDDVQSQHSFASFRTRTDSSSIGDYESHTSDYDDSEDENEVFDNGVFDDDDDDDGCDDDESDNIAIENLEADDLLTDLPGLNLLNGEQFMFTENCIKKRTFSSNTIDSDVDVANFDLAEFITKDDDLMPQAINATTETSTLEKIINTKLVNEKVENDSDSDVIVDVETVEFEDIKNGESLLMNKFSEIPDDNLAFVDNVKADPEWNPNEVKLNASNANVSTSSNKMSNAAKSGNVHGKSNAIIQKSYNLTPKKQVLKSTQANVQKTPRQQGIGKGGKNLVLLKRDCESIEKKEIETKTKVKVKDIAQIKHDNYSIELIKQNSIKECNNNNNNNNINSNYNNSNNSQKVNAETEKRKLNIEEYKRRYGEDFNIFNREKINENKTITNEMIPKSKITIPTQTLATSLKTATTATSTITTLKPKTHSEAVISVVKTLKEQQVQQKQLNEKIDPITLAKNKVLRMQELKRAQQMKIIDSTISAKVPRVTKLLPLQEIIKDTAYAIKTNKDEETNNEIEIKKQTEYEKIVMVSVGCNTALTFSPKDILPNVPLLQNKLRSPAQHLQISHNSLITSIQDAVIKQSLPKPMIVGGKNISMPKKACTLETQHHQQHGEDKIIMHLRKDRIRENNTTCMDVQTDFQPAFPILPMPKFLRNLRLSRRRYRNHKTSEISSINSCMDSSPSDIDDIVVENVSGGRSVTEVLNSRSNVAVVSISTIEYQNSEINGCGTSSIGGYSSRSSRRHRSSVSSSYSESGIQQRSTDRKRRTSYRKSMRKQRRNSSSSSSSFSDYSDRSRSRSRSRNPKRNRTRSRSPLFGDSNLRREPNYIDRNVSKPAVEERRIVYVGRIEEETTKEMLRRKFITYGSIRQITIHYKENGMKYGFVTFERSEDAFAVIDNSTRDSQIKMYDISFGGRRAFCRTSYADLDNAGINNYQSYVFPKAVAPKQEESFEALLQKVKAKLGANKSTPSQEKNKL